MTFVEDRIAFWLLAFALVFVVGSLLRHLASARRPSRQRDLTL
jgi:hypothetical protein